MISLIVTIVVLGIIAWAIGLSPIPGPYKQIINGILVIAAILALLSAVGVNVPLLHLK